MAYNRLEYPGQPHEEEYYNGGGRTPSPAVPMRQQYHLEDAPSYHQTQVPFERNHTPYDTLMPQPTYSVAGLENSFGHNEAYNAAHPLQPGHDYHGDYGLDPNAHQEAYYNQPYRPNPSEGSEYDHQGQYYHDDNRPILQGSESYGPDPHTGYDGSLAPTPSPAPGIRRWKTVKKQVQLFNGNLVLDCPVPPALLSQVKHAPPPERDEFTHMRYTAATCDPSDFKAERFELRQNLFRQHRTTQLFIVVTMYNENDLLFARTMAGVFQNVEYICNKVKNATWVGKEAWKNIVVCIVSDGRAKINPRTRAVLAGMGVYQDGIAKQKVNNKDVTAHIYEYTTQVGISIKNDVVKLTPGKQPVQILFCLKEKNQKKINSHRWFFSAFGDVLQPNVCVLIDAGTRPGKDSIYELWKAFDLNSNCAGACGEIKAMTGTLGRKNLTNPLVAAQNFEYKMSNILDKPLESAFGFISVLPGAFSAYRYSALQNDKTGQGPLEKYFAGEKMHGANAGIFTANMYLAEDRILCFELVSKRGSRWILSYVKSAVGETDVPETLTELILQRRRWLNGSFFAAIYAIAHFYQLFRSKHGLFRQIAFLVEFVYQTINMIFAWFAIGNFFLVFHILTTSLGADSLLGETGKILGLVFEWAYITCLLTCFILAMGNRPQGTPQVYMVMVVFWAIIMLYLMFASVYITIYSVKTTLAEKNFTASELFSDSIFFTLIVSLASTYVLYFIVSFIFCDPWHMFHSFLQYLLLTPTYINVLNVYAFCNTHDITWGTKGDDKAEKLPSAEIKADGKVDVSLPDDESDLNAQYRSELHKLILKEPEEKRSFSDSEKQEDYYKRFRSIVVVFWMATNLGLTALILNTGGVEQVDTTTTEADKATIYMAVILWSVAGLSAFRFVGAMWFLVVRMFRGV